jgi:hypothetical protein
MMILRPFFTEQAVGLTNRRSIVLYELLTAMPYVKHTPRYVDC